MKSLRALFFNFTECHGLINPEIILSDLPHLEEFSVLFGMLREEFSTTPTNRLHNSCMRLVNPIIGLRGSRKLEDMRVMLSGCKKLDLKSLIWLLKSLLDDFDGLKNFELNCELCENVNLFRVLFEKFEEVAPNSIVNF